MTSTLLDPKNYVHVKAQHSIASFAGPGLNLQLLAVIDGNVASYKVTNHGTRVLYEGPSSEAAAEAFNLAQQPKRKAA